MPIIPNLFKEKPVSKTEVIPDLFQKTKVDPEKVVPDLFPPGLGKRLIEKIKPTVRKIIPAITGKIALETPALDKEQFKATFGFEPVQNIRPPEKKLPKKVIPDLVEVPKEGPETKVKDIWDAFRLGASEIWHKSKQYFTSALPNSVFKDVEPVSYSQKTGIPVESLKQRNIQYKQLRTNFKEKYLKADNKYQSWLKSHPELQPRKEWERGVIETVKGNPRILLDPAYWGYVAAKSAAFTLGVMGTTLAVTAATGGNIWVGMGAGVAVATPMQAQDLYEDLMNEGATEEQAGQLATVIGPVIAAVEVAGDLPLLRAVSKPFSRLLTRNIQRELTKRTVAGLVKKGLKTFTAIEIAETLEEITQGAIQDATVKTVNENRDILASIPETTVQTLMATLPFAIAGVGGAVGREIQPITPEGPKVEAPIPPPEVVAPEKPEVTLKKPPGKVKGLDKLKTHLQAAIGRPLNDMEKESLDTIPEGQSIFIEDFVITQTPETPDTFDIIDKEQFNIMLNGFMEKERTETLKGIDTLYQVIKRHGGIKSYKKGPGGLREEYRVNVPIFLRNNSGLPLDEMASTLGSQHPEFGITTENELLEALQKEKTARMNGVRETQGEYIAEKADKLIFGKKPSELVQKTLFGPEEKVPVKAKPSKPAPGQPELPFGARPEFPIKPKEKVSPSPIRPPGPEWTTDPGAMPGEPFLLHKKGVLIEREVGLDMVLYEALNNEGQSLGVFQDVPSASKAVEGVKLPGKINLAALAEETPDTNDLGAINYWKTEGDKQIYIEGWCDKCFPGQGSGNIEAKLDFARDVTPKTLAAKAKEKGLELIEGRLIETPDKSFIHAVTVGVYQKTKVVTAKERDIRENVFAMKKVSLGHIQFATPQQVVALKTDDTETINKFLDKHVTAERIKDVKEYVGDTANVVYVPVPPAVGGQNKLPSHFANRLASQVGGVVNNEVATLPKKIGKRCLMMDDYERLVTTREFKIDPTKLSEGKDIFIVDDVMTDGGTIRDLTLALRRAGYGIKGFVTLGSSRKGLTTKNRLFINSDTEKMLRTKFSAAEIKEIETLTGYRVDQLTEIEARIILKEPGIESFRKKIVKAQAKYGIEARPTKAGKLESKIELIIKKKGIMYARDLKIESNKDVADIFYELKNADREKMFVINIDADNKIINVENVSIGTLFAALVHPREVLKNSLLSKAKKISFVHNHPSENVEASNEDVKILGLLSRAARKFKITTLEGIIINKTEYGVYGTTGRGHAVPYTPEKPTKEIPLVEIEVKTKPSSFSTRTISGPGDAAKIGKNLIETNEPALVALFLNTRKQVNATYMIGQSPKSMDQVANAIIKNGILTNSAAIVISTNIDIRDRNNLAWFNGIRKLVEKSEAIEFLDVVQADLKEPSKYKSLMEEMGYQAAEEKKDLYIKEPTPEEMRAKDWQVDMPGEPELGKVINKTKIIQWAEKAFKVPIRGKATHRFKAAGLYYPKQALIRLMKWGELEPMMHEIAHHMDRLVMKILGAKWKKEMAPLGQRKEVIKELADLDYNKKRRATIEGFAEFIRHYLTTGKAKELAPLFHKFFTNTFLKAHPEFEGKLTKLKEMLEIWQKQGAVNRVLQQIDFKGEHTKIGGWVARLVKAKDWILKNFNDEFYLIKKIEDQMGIKVGVNIRPTQDPYTMATYMKTKSSIIARTFVEEKAIDEYGNVVGKGLQEILKPIVRGEMKSWIAYAVAKRSVALNARGIESGIDLDDAKFIIEKYRKDSWDKAVEGVTEWNNHLLDWIVRAGGLGLQEAKMIRGLNPVYLPFKRAFIDEIMVVKGTGGIIDRGQAVKKIKGSGRAIINPIEAMIAQATEMIAKAHKIRLARLIAELAKREGIGGIIVKVPAPIQVQKFNLQRVKDIRGFLREMGLDPEDVDIDQILTAFTQGWQYFGKDNVVSIWENGKRVFYEVHPDLYRAISGVDILKLPKIVRVLFTPFARLLRLGATGLKISFGLARNPFRDAFTHATFSKRKMAIPIWDTLKGVYREIVVKTGSLTWRFKRAGGSLSGMMGLDRAATMAHYDNFLSNKLGRIGKVLKVCKHPIDSLRGLLSFTEMAPRSSEIEAMYKIYKRKHPDWNEEDWFVSAFNDAQDVTVNFTKSGYYAKRINEVAAFFNVAIRGPEKLGRSLKERPFATIIKGITWITIPAILLWYRNRRKEWYKNLPPSYKYNNFFLDNDIIPSLPDNVIVRLPIPFELGILFASAPTCALDILYTKNPKYVEGLWQQIKMQIPDPTPSVFKPWIHVASNKDFLNRPIESEGMQFLYPTERRRHYTTGLAVSLSKAFDKLSMPVSPVQIDYMIDSYTGGFARQLPLRPIIEPADIPVVGDLLLRMPSRPQRQTNDFFSTYEVLSQKKQSGIASREEIRQLNKMKPVYNHLITFEFKQLKKYHEKRDIENIGRIYEKINRLLKRAGFE